MDVLVKVACRIEVKLTKESRAVERAIRNPLKTAKKEPLVRFVASLQAGL